MPFQRRLGACSATPVPGGAVAIIGAGFSGTVAAIHLRRLLPPGTAIYLFDRTGRFARGPAYAAGTTPHLLNVRSGNMSALPDDPGHFERWLADRAARWPGEVHAEPAGTFATRRLYGRYLRSLLYAEMTRSGGRVLLCADEVVRLTPQDRGQGRGWCLRCRSGREVGVDAVVVAVGTLPPARPGDGLVFHDPWAPCATAGLRPDEAVLVVGTGLTMVDLALGMHEQGFAGPIVALSRRGLVPQRHGEPRPAIPCDPRAETGSLSLTTLLRHVRRRIREAVVAGADWRAVIDGLRPVTASLWGVLPAAERARFLRHLRPYWDIHRHRLAPSHADEFARLQAAGTLRLKRGRIRSIEARTGPHGPVARVEIQDRGAAVAEAIEVQRVIYATGIGSGAREDGLMAGLIGAGLVRTDPHGLGIEVTDRLQVLDRAGRPAAAWALGPIVRGVFWECTSVPDIRIQARTVATEVARHIGST